MKILLEYNEIMIFFYNIIKAAYLWYKTTKFTAKKFYYHVIMGERAWIYEMERQNSGFGEYFFEDVPVASEESFPDLARGEMAKNKWEEPDFNKTIADIKNKE